jgi:hypothetical protein
VLRTNISLVLRFRLKDASAREVNSGILAVRSDLFSQFATAVFNSAFVEIAIYDKCPSHVLNALFSGKSNHFNSFFAEPFGPSISSL